MGTVDVTITQGAQSDTLAGAFEYVEPYIAPDLSTASYDSVSHDVGPQDGSPHGVAFSSDGTKMYVLGASSDTVYQYSLSSAWDLSSASYDSVSHDVSSQDSSPFGIAFSSDGTKMYMVGRGNNTVYQYSLSTAWDLSSASYDSVSFSIGSQDGFPYDIAFSSDGTKMYMVGFSNKTVYQYSLSTAWDLSSASYDSVSHDVSSQDSSHYGLTFSLDGTKMYALGTNSDTVYQYSLSSAWDVSTASYDSVSHHVGPQDGVPLDIAFSSDGTKMYVVGSSSDTIYQYSV